MEPSRNHPRFDLQKKRRILWKLNAAELFETFLHSHYVGQKRFSLEGGEMLIPLLDALIERAGQHGVREIVMGMPHRGRLNVLANLFDKPLWVDLQRVRGQRAEDGRRRWRREVPPGLLLGSDHGRWACVSTSH